MGGRPDEPDRWRLAPLNRPGPRDRRHSSLQLALVGEIGARLAWAVAPLSDIRAALPPQVAPLSNVGAALPPPLAPFADVAAVSRAEAVPITLTHPFAPREVPPSSNIQCLSDLTYAMLPL